LSATLCQRKPNTDVQIEAWRIGSPKEFGSKLGLFAPGSRSLFT
jgi:hypothetical protein